jgi:hypothetical protein
MLKIEFPTLNFDLVPVTITSFVVIVSLHTKFTPLCVIILHEYDLLKTETFNCWFYIER